MRPILTIVLFSVFLSGLPSVAWSEQGDPAFPSISGTWTGWDPRVARAANPEVIEQDRDDRSRLIFRNHFGSVSKGRFLSPTTIVADEWEGGLRGTLENNGTLIRWANGSRWSRSQPSNPPSTTAFPSISGAWIGSDPRFGSTSGGRESIEQDQNDGSRLVLRNHSGGVSRGRFLNSTTIVADEWEGGLRGTLENNGNTIRWANGSRWSRSQTGDSPGTPAFPSIGGTWTGWDPRVARAANPEVIEQDRDDRSRLVFRNHFGSVSKGRFLSPTTIVADEWEGGLHGTLENNGTLIRWANGSRWSR